MRYLSVLWRMSSVALVALWSMSNVVKWLTAVNESAPASHVVCFDSGHWSKHSGRDVLSKEDARLRTYLNILVYILPYTLKFLCFRLFEFCSVSVWDCLRTGYVKMFSKHYETRLLQQCSPLSKKQCIRFPAEHTNGDRFTPCRAGNNWQTAFQGNFYAKHCITVIFIEN